MDSVGRGDRALPDAPEHQVTQPAGMPPLASAEALPDPPAPLDGGPTTPRPPPSYRLTRQVFLRLLGVVYLIAFLSYWVQADGLIGSRGILPVKPFLEAQRQAFPTDYVWNTPTLLWLNSSDAFLHVLCGGAVVLALLVIAGIDQAACLALLWVDYLSLTVAGQDFFEFQWDALLLEAGLVAVFFAPLQLGPRLSRQPPPSRWALWLLWWLLFRLMFLSGLVKLLSGDPSWRDGTAMNYHYLTQPLPTAVSWYAYQLPSALQFVSVWAMFAIELLAPWLIFCGRTARRIPFCALVLLQLLIAGTGNYGFFNLLTIALCVPLLDDTAWPRRLRAWAGLDAPSPAPSGLRWPAWVVGPVAAVLIVLTTLAGVARTRLIGHWRAPLRAVLIAAAPFRSANGYGLFEVMTRNRREIVIEGSDDGQTWKAYEFKWKPGDPSRRPGFAGPHMPRLDWQAWAPFLESGDGRWFIRLLVRLLEGSPPVLRLLEYNPFPGAPPRYVRAVMYDYRFADGAALRTGLWWRRTWLGEFVGPASLKRSSAGDERPPATTR